jgi:ribosomal protein S18 acetylase RimI-like enzyme
MTVKRADKPVTPAENSPVEDPAVSEEASGERTPLALNVRQQLTVVHPSGVILRAAMPEDDPTVAQFYFDMWADYDMTAMLTADWQAQTLAFIAYAREHLNFSAFIAERPPEDTIVANQPAPYQPASYQHGSQPEVLGVAACQHFGGLYPWVFTPEKRTHGYIWGVRVVPDARRRGIARLLVSACCDYLRELGCHRVRLHAATQGKALYESLGFTLSNEMVLELDQPALDDTD